MKNNILLYITLTIITSLFMISCVKQNNSIVYYDNEDCYAAQINDFESKSIDVIEAYNNKPVTILNKSVTINYKLESIYLPSITTISTDCFEDFYNLSYVYMPKIIEIQDSAFYNCQSLKMIYFSSSLNSISDNAFKNCLNLDVIFVENDIENIGKNVFPENVTIISKKNSNIYAYAIKNGLKHLEKNDDLENIFKVNYKPNQENLEINDIKFNNKEYTSLFNHKIKDLDNLIIPNNVEKILNKSLSFTNITTLNTNDVVEICDNSVSNCSLLKSIFIPNAKIIGSKAFQNSINLNTIFISSDNITISNSAFNDTKYSLNIYFLGDADIENGAIPKLSTVWCKKNSSVHNYSLRNNINYVLI